MVAFASLLAADVTAILAFCTVPACLLCNSGIADFGLFWIINGPDDPKI